ncbi:MAG TPA: hypothetical protein VK420_16230 [Longimicrobium sp.]|nr:hypothetical protein [Longimicrobium sp.]
MENEYDFSSGERGAVVPDAVRITLCLDNDVLDWFRARVDASGGGDYQSLIRPRSATTYSNAASRWRKRSAA